MGLDFAYSWALLLIPLGIAAVCLIDRRYRPRHVSLKRRVTLAIRVALVAVLALAIASPSILVPSGKTERWILLDVSDSAASSQPEMQEALIAALGELPKGEEAGVIAFGRNAMVEIPLSESPTFVGRHTAVKGDGSDLNGALLLANALTSTGGVSSMLVLSDGRTAASENVISMLKARGVKVDTRSFASDSAEDAQLAELVVPAEVYEGQRVSVEAVVDANAAMNGTLSLYQNGELSTTRDVKLEKGENRFVFTDVAKQTGVVTYEARLLCPNDTQSRNNRASAYVRVSGAPRVLVISRTEGVYRMLASTGMKVSRYLPGELPDSAEGYLPYDAVVLNNIDYDDASLSQWTALNDAVRTLGRGLCVLGGDSSYALGGYRGTVLEELLPVTIDVRDKQRMPSLSLVIAIDKSGSMTEGQFGTSRIEVAKEAAIRATEVLTERDQIGVIAFDGTAKWAVPFQKVSDPAAIEGLIGSIRADGGTAFYSAMSEAYEALVAADTPQKHMILLSDGQPGDTGFQDIALAMKKAGITLTTVAVGNGADTRLMSLLSTLGGGRNYQAGEFDNIPKIFTKETMLVSGSYVQNRAFIPVVTESAALTAYDGFPALNGYLTAVEKPTATVSMVTDWEDPLLAWWNAGGGKVVAWTSDAEGAWSENYLRWEQGPAFFGGMVAKTLPGSGREGTVTAEADGDELKISYSVSAATEENLRTEVTVLGPDGSQQTVTLTEAEAGRFEGSAIAPEQGAYALRVSQSRGDTVVRTQEGGAVKSYAREYDLRGAADGLSELAQKTGGKELASGDPFWSAAAGSWARRRMLTALCILALALWVCDIALRRLSWEAWMLTLLGKHDPKEKTEGMEATKSKPSKPDQPMRESRATRERATQEAAAHTAEALLSAKRAREKH